MTLVQLSIALSLVACGIPSSSSAEVTKVTADNILRFTSTTQPAIFDGSIVGRVDARIADGELDVAYPSPVFGLGPQPQLWDTSAAALPSNACDPSAICPIGLPEPSTMTCMWMASFAYGVWRLLCRGGLRLFMSAVLFSMASRLPLRAQPASPTIHIPAPPAWGDQNGTLSGFVTGLVEGNYKAAVFLYVEGAGFFSKPTCASPTSPLVNNTFTTDVTTGGVDAYAEAFAVLILPATATVDCYTSALGIPEQLKKQAVASLTVLRPDPNQRQIEFSGETWVVKKSIGQVGPDGNYFCDTNDNVRVDEQGRLHLRVTFRNGRWCASEIISKRSVSYGRYVVEMGTPSNLDVNVVFGAFTWAARDNKTREIDFEYWRDTTGTNAQFAVQQPLVVKRFSLPNTVPASHAILWTPSTLQFESRAGGNIAQQWLFDGNRPVPDSDRINFRLNLWLRRAAAPANGQEVEVIINRFTYEPAGGPCAGDLSTTSLSAGENGAFGTTRLTVPSSSCTWTASSESSWAQVYPLSGAGSGDIQFEIDPNFRTTARVTTINVAGRLFTIDEAAGIGSLTRRFIRLLYYFYFGRTPTEAEVMFHAQSGLSWANMVQNFAASEEFALGGLFIAGNYRGILDRDSEFTGWKFQRNAVVRGRMLQVSLSKNFLESAEFQVKHPNLSDEDFVRLLYRQILLREGSVEEVAGQTDGVRASGRAQVAVNFLNSAEFRQRRGARLAAFLLYATLLQRDATAAEFNAAVQSLQNGVPLINLISDIVNGSEFLANLN